MTVHGFFRGAVAFIYDLLLFTALIPVRIYTCLRTRIIGPRPKPSLLPTVRRRLSDPSVNSQVVNRSRWTFGAVRQRTIRQEKSPFFALPYEIREMIYRLCVCSERIIIVDDYRRLGHRFCRWDQCGHKTVRDPCAWGTHYLPLLPLVKTCRQMYMEGIDILYQYPTFAFDSFSLSRKSELFEFSSSIPLQRLNTITSIDLRLTWACTPEERSLWTQYWEALYKMQGLKRLSITIHDTSTTALKKEDMLGPARKILPRLTFYKFESPWFEDSFVAEK